MKTLFRYLLAILLVVAGVGHFVATERFMAIMPPYLPWHRELVLISGFFEILIGSALCFRPLVYYAGWAAVALFVAVFPANLYLFQHQEILPAPYVVHLLRLPLQGVLIVWAWWLTRRNNE